MAKKKSNGEARMRCHSCNEKISVCTNCGKKFEEEDDVWCMGGTDHFCEACIDGFKTRAGGES